METIQKWVLDILFYPLILYLHYERDRVLAPIFEWFPIEQIYQQALAEKQGPNSKDAYQQALAEKEQQNLENSQSGAWQEFKQRMQGAFEVLMILSLAVQSFRK